MSQSSVLFIMLLRQRSTNNHFMFWKKRPGMGNFKEPTSFDRRMGFEKWLAKAHEADEQKLEAESEHLYFHKVTKSKLL